MSRDFGDPIAMLIGPGATELDIAHLRRLFGLRAGRRHRPPVRLPSAGSRRPGRGRNGVTGVRADSVTLDVALRWNGTEVRCRAGETVAVALLCAGRLDVRRSPRTGSPRGAFCMMGVCQECLVRIDGVPRQACLTPVEDGMRVESVDPGGAV